MNSSQDAWATPLARRLIGRFRSQALTYIKNDFGAYDETTGEITSNETLYAAAGAVAYSRKTERDGTQQGNEVEVWVDHEVVPWPISTSDSLKYLGRRWKIIEIESYGSGGDGSSVGPIYLTTLDGKIIATLDGKQFIVQGSESVALDYTMYASKIVARAE